MAKEKKLLGYTQSQLNKMSYEDLKDLHFDIVDEREGLPEMSKKGIQLDDLLLWVEGAMAKKKEEMNYITLYADEFPADIWEDYCRAAGVPKSATEITLWFKEEDVEYEDGDEEDDENSDEEDDHKTIKENACDCIALTEYEGGEPVHYTKSDKELQEWLDADEEHSWFPVDNNPEDDEEE